MPHINIAVVHDLGKRPAQEDTYLTYKAANIKGTQDAMDFLDNFHRRTLECTNDYKSQGSCAISTVYLPEVKQVVCSNIGDSQATVFVWRESTKQVESRVLNNLHKASSEALRPRAEDGRTLRVTRIYGNAAFEKSYGFRRMLDSEVFDVSRLGLEENDRAFLMTSCHGFFKGSITTETYTNAIASYLNNTPGATTEQVLQECFNTVTKDKSGDNLTAFLMELTHKSLENEENAIVTQVFDGHGGSKVSKKIVKNAKRNILNNKEHFLEVYSSEDITLGYLGYSALKIAALSVISIGANILALNSQSKIAPFISSVAIAILCERYMHNDRDKQMPIFIKPGEIFEIPLIGNILKCSIQFRILSDKSIATYVLSCLLKPLTLVPLPQSSVTIPMLGFYLCNTYIAPSLFASSDALSQALISAAASVGTAVILPAITDNISLTR